MAFWEYAFLACVFASAATGVFQIHPSNVTGLNGAQLVISCYADSDPAEVRWTVDGNAVVTSQSLRIGYADGEGVVTFSPLGYQHEGVYRCTAYDNSGGELFRSYPGRVRVYGLPGFITPPASVGVLQGEVGVFTCVVGSNPPGNTSWLFKGEVLQSSDKYRVLPERLEVASVQTEDEGYYECLASNIYGTVPVSARLYIVNELSQAPVAVVDPGSLVMVANGSELALNCSVSGHPTPVIHWLRDGRVLGEGARVSVHRQPRSSLLVVRAVESADGGTYTCFSNNSVGSDTERVTVSVLVRPSLSVVPHDITAREGEELGEPIVCEAQGFPPPVVAILNPQGGIVGEAGVWTPPTPLTRGIGGTYQCMAENEVGQASAAFLFSVEGVPVIAPPHNITQFIGEEALLPCEAVGPPPPVVAWSRLDSTSLPTNHDLTGSALRLHGLSLDNSGSYLCTATNRLGTAEAVTWLSVVVRPTVEILPSEVFVVTGGNFTLMCLVTPLTPGLVYTWSLEGAPLPETTPTLRVPVASAENAGRYICQVALETPISRTVQVTVGDSPKISVLPPLEVNLLPGNQYRLDCVVTGNPKPAVSWEFTDPNGTRSVLSDTGSIRLYSNGSLYLPAAARGSTGTYHCVASNGVGRVAAATELRVEGAPLAVDITPTHLLLGGRATLSCSLIYDYPASTLSWTSPSSSALAVVSEGRLVLETVRQADAGLYTCTARNSYGESRVSKVLAVHVPPMVTVPSSRVQVYLDSSVRVMCEGEGVPPPHVYWITVQGVMVNSSVLELMSAQLSDAGEYVCFGVSSAGASSVTITVVVRGAPPTGAQAEEVTKQNVSLSWQSPLYNASLLYYIVEYRETRQNGYVYPTVATNSTFLSVSGFDEGTEHQFTVSGFFQGGVVGENISLLVTTQEDAPSAAPVGVALSPRYSALVVTWQPPPVRDRNGVITGYNLYYRVTPDGVGVANETYTELSVAPGGRHQLEGLVGDTSYDVVMQAVTSAGAGPNSTVVMATALRLPIELILSVSIVGGALIVFCCCCASVCLCVCCYRRRRKGGGIRKKGKLEVGDSKDGKRRRKQKKLLISGPIPDDPPFIDPDNPGKFAVRNRAGDLVVLQPKVVTADDIAPPPLEGQTAQPVRQVKLRQTAPMDLYSEPNDSLTVSPRAGEVQELPPPLSTPPSSLPQTHPSTPARGSSEIQVVNQAFEYMSEFDDETPYAVSPGGGAVPLDADAVLDAFVASQDKELLYTAVPPEHVASKREKKQQRSVAKVERKGWRAYQQRSQASEGSESAEESLLQDFSYGLPTLVEVDTHTSEGRRQQKRIDGAAAVMY